MQQRKTVIRRRENLEGYLFIMPFIIGFLLFTAVPICVSFYLSFTKYDILSSPRWTGLSNYIKMFTSDRVFWTCFKVTLFYAFVSVPLKLFMSLMVAMLLMKPKLENGIFRAIYYIPSILGGSIAIAVVWCRLFATDGAINNILGTLGLPDDISWLSRTDTAIWTLIVLAIWQFGSSMLIFTSGLQQIPTELYEAARVDGAGKIVQFFRITLPMLTPVIFFNLVQQLINGFMAFTSSYVITGGAPLNSTLFYSVYLYQQAFQFSKMGYASAMAWFMLFVVALMTILLFKSSDRWVFYETK
ncbi:MAG: sugar ABC transporter permease [Lachnospiraceae bacterium]|nr:sugar ABC transporter permease [Lachnospiraceae bacterium]